MTSINYKNKEGFLGEYKSLLSDDPSNEYYTDRNGRKGTIYQHLSNKPLFNKLKKKSKIMSFQHTINKLELYTADVYNECESDFIQSDIVDSVINNDPINVYLPFNQGVLYNQQRKTQLRKIN
jgi:hypothetical protein